MNMSKFYHLFLDWKRKAYDNLSKKELLSELTCPSTAEMCIAMDT